MTAVAATGMSTDALITVLSSSSQAASMAGSVASAAAPAGASSVTSRNDSATMLDLSEQTKALLQQAKANQAAAQDIPASFSEMVAKRTNDFAATLVKAFTAAHIPLDDAIALQVDSSGAIHTNSPYKEKIEQYFKDNPEAAKEFKTVAALNALKATEEALSLYNKEKKSATTKEKQAAASDRYMVRSMDIQSLSGFLTLKNGRFASAAMDYATSLVRSESSSVVATSG